MDNQPTVSVVIIFFNSKKFIEEAVESVLNQTFSSWELLLVDDGSTDTSTEIALNYAKQYPGKVFYFQHEGHQNRGMSATRNLGMGHARGKYIALLDSDDVWLPHKLERQVAIMESQPEAAMVCGPSQKWYSWTGNCEDIERDSYYNLGTGSNTLIQPPMLVDLCLKGKAITPCPSNILFRRELIDRVGGFEEDWKGIYQLYEDQVFLNKVYLAESVYVSDECWDKYRKHPNSCVAVAKKTGNEAVVRLAFLEWLEKYLNEQGLENAEIRKTLRQEKFLSHPWFASRIPPKAKQAIRSFIP